MRIEHFAFVLLMLFDFAARAEISVADGAGLSSFSDVNAVSNVGQVRQSLELVSMEGRGGLTPKLSLAFGRRWLQAEAGDHWSLQLPRIIRSPDRLSTYDGHDRFLSTRYGYLTKSADGYYRPVNASSGAFFLFKGGTWIEFRINGQRTVYGGGEATVGRTGRENVWFIAQELGENCPAPSCDRVEYAYAGEKLDEAREWPRLREVSYNFVAETAKTKIQLRYAKRAVARSTYAYSEVIRDSWRLATVTLVHDGENALENALEYDADDLVQLRKTGRQGLPFPSTRVAYTPATEWNFKSVAVRGEGSPLFARAVSAYVVADFDGDGIPDYYYQEATHGYLRRGALRNGELVFLPAQDFGHADDLSAKSSLAFLADMNGDGLPDFLQYSGGPKVRWNSRDGGWGAKAAVGLPEFANVNRPGVEVMDVNRDGLVDFVTRYDRTCWINDGKGQFRSFRAEGAIGPSNNVSTRMTNTLVLGDVNGDQVVDFLELEGNRLYVYYGDGICSWSGRVPLELPAPSDLTSSSRKILADIDGDGMNDLLSITAGEVTVYRNEAGRGFARKQSVRIDTNAQTFVVDLDGNGTKEILTCKTDRGCQALRLEADFQPGLLQVVESTLGLRTEYAYKSITEDYSSEWSRFVPFIGPVVASQHVSDGLGLDAVAEYSYVNAYFDPWLREFNGYEIVREKVPDSKSGSRVVRPAFVTERLYDLGIRDDDSQLIPTVKRGQTLKSTVEGRQTQTAIATYVEFEGAVVPVSSLQSDYREEGGVKVGSSTFSRYNSLGQMTDQYVYPNVVTEDRLADAGWDRHLSQTYLADGANPQSEKDIFASRVTASRSVDPAGGILEAKTIAYSDLKAGRVQSVKTQGCADQWVERQFEYDGEFDLQVTAIKDAVGKPIQTMVLDPTGLWAAKQANGAGEWQSETRDPVFGQTLETRDANGVVTRYAYDGRGELVATEQTKNGRRLRFTKTEVTLGSRGRPTTRASESWNSDGPPTKKIVFSDPRGETIKTYKPSSSGAWIVDAWTARASGGETAWKLNFPDLASASFPTARSEITYDAEGRVVSEFDTRVGAATRLAWETTSCGDAPCLTQTQWDKNDRVTRWTFDGLRRRISTAYPDANGSSTYAFAYRGPMVSAVTLPSGKRREIFAVGEQTCEVRDPYSGGQRQTFDLRGRLQARLRGSQMTERLQYDDADRVVDRETSAASGKKSKIHTSYGRRPDANEVGRIVRVDWEGGSDQTAYAPTGEVIALDRTLHLPDGDKTFRVERDYDALGRLRNERVGDLRMSYAYDAAGLVANVPGVIDEVRYDDFGRRTLLALHDGSRTTYEPLSGFLQNQRLSVSKGADQFSIEYAYDREMNVTGRARSDGFDSLAFNYGGNALYFLSSQRGSVRDESVAEVFNYDADGTPVAPNSERNEIGQAAQADSARLTFDARDHVDSVSTADSRVAYVFDHAGELAVRSKGGRVTDIALTPSVLLTGSDLHPVLQARLAGLAVGQSESGGPITFTHFDQTGTPVAATSTADETLKRVVFDGWGRARVDQRENTSELVPGLNLGRIDRATGQLLYGSRHYSPGQRQFVSTDKSLLDRPTEFVDDPVQFNPFSFNRNNALKFVDPNGKWAVRAVVATFTFGIAAYDAYTAHQAAKTHEMTDNQAYAMAGTAFVVSGTAGLATGGGSLILTAEHVAWSVVPRWLTTQEARYVATELAISRVAINTAASTTRNAANQLIADPSSPPDLGRALKAGFIDGAISLTVKEAASVPLRPLGKMPDWLLNRAASKIPGLLMETDKGYSWQRQPASDKVGKGQ